jgi:acyl-CoA dehydrogenase
MDVNLPFFDDAHRKLAADLERWCAANLRDNNHDGDVDAACRHLVTQLGEAGWLRYCLPSAYGGALPQLDSRALCLLRETLAYHDGLADFSFAMQGLGSGAITLFGTDEQKQTYLPKVAFGEAIAAFAATPTC